MRVRDVGADAEAVVRRAGLSHSAARLLDPAWAGVLARDEFARLYAECTWALDAHAAAQEGRRPLSKSEFDLFCHAVITSRDLREAISRATTFSTMLSPRMAKLDLRIEDEVADLRMPTERRRRNVSAFVSDLTGLASFVRLFGWLIGEDLPLLDVTVRYPPLLSAEAAARLMPHPIRYGAPENGLRFAARYLDRAVVRTPGELAQLLDRFPFDPEEPQSKARSLAERVRLLLGAALAQGASLPTGAALARQFSISRATLTRHLAQEGVTLGQLQAASRRELAQDLLLHAGQSVAEIAGRVGFSDSTTFSRAFKAWTGASPTRWTRQAGRARSATGTGSEAG